MMHDKTGEIWRKFAQKREIKLWKFCRVAKIGKLRIFATLLTCVDCFLTRLSLWFYTSLPSCNFGSLAHFCNFLILSTYISSVLFVIKSTFHSINQSGWHEASSLYWFVIFSPSPSFFLHFLTSQTPLDDEKSMDARLKPPDP